MNGEEIDENDSELFELACDNKIIDFFNKLPSVLKPIEALQYFSESAEFVAQLRSDSKKDMGTIGIEEEDDGNRKGKEDN